MNRELSIDAAQVSLGDHSILTLELSTDPQERALDAQLAHEGALLLVFDNLSTDRALELKYRYRIHANGDFELDPDDRVAGGQYFLHITPTQLPDNLAGRSHATLHWQVNSWDDAGTYNVRGLLAPLNPYWPDKGQGNFPEPLDFGPIKLVVAEQEEKPVRVTLNEAGREETTDQPLWSLIRHRTIDFTRYRAFVDNVLCVKSPESQQLYAGGMTGRNAYFLPFNRLASYAMLKHATELYLMQEAGLAPEALDASGGNLNQLPPSRYPDEPRRLGPGKVSMSKLRDNYLEQLEDEEGRVLPYFKVIREKLKEVPLKDFKDLGKLRGIGNYDLCYGILKSKLTAPPLMELIWSYWHEEGGLVQTMNALCLRFQNVRRAGPGPDPLANLNVDPLRPLNNLVWGYIEDERNRLTLNRRNLEYQYEYGISLIGRAVQSIPVAEHRTFFLRGFHSLLRAAVEFFQQANFTTVIPDGFPILNHLREVHLMLAEGAHNQYGDLPWTARAEMLMQQWLLARPEVREFLGGRIMVPYQEAWMDRVDNMKQLQGWNPTNVSHFHDLGAFGEQLLLSIRYGSWNSPTVGATNAANWAYYWREEIQRYIHAYKAVTGVDLASDVVDARVSVPSNEDRYLQPAQLIERQVAIQQSQLRAGRPALAPPAPARLATGVPVVPAAAAPVRRELY
ncbi:hypothetical protein EJV47_05710 [Hymenobacter gummosus]|uniref:8-amino-7-oxononanoate synthase n=1 Tax=Hymenobacter gummosus TaxID=1776032 RepID=A0A431U8C4_9BACT|nr:hypothetical protein [Hymenobacter gummosus]RTQ52507.1 hypothetical protein EJV47_05710 [Hymenobacter gummosus]